MITSKFTPNLSYCHSFCRPNRPKHLLLLKFEDLFINFDKFKTYILSIRSMLGNGYSNKSHFTMLKTILFIVPT